MAKKSISPHDQYVAGSRQVTLITPGNKKLGGEDIFKAHQHPAKLHRAPSVWLSRYGSSIQKTEVLLQRRSQHKPIGAEWWGNAICGNVKPDESYLECAYRRLQEELGIDNPRKSISKFKKLYSFSYQAYGNETYGEHERVQVYLGQFDRNFNLNPEEVSQVWWIPAQDLIEWAQKTPYVSPKETLKMSLEELREKTQPPVFKWREHSLKITPWTMMMLKDKRLASKLLE